MSEAEKRRKDREELHDMLRLIEPAKNEDIARRAISIADYYLIKAENQAKHIQDLEARNSKQPTIEPKKGRWIDYSDEGFVECPFCHSATNCDDNKKELHYCFSCGADMREGD